MKKIKKEYKILPRTLDQSFDMLISMEVTDHIESGNTDKRFGTYISINRKTGFGNRSKENIDEFLQVVIEKNIRFLKEHY
jgi:hypothetical protein